MKSRRQSKRIPDKATELVERMEQEELADMEEVKEWEREMQSRADEFPTPDKPKKTYFLRPTTKQALMEDDADGPEDVELTRALAEWEEEFEQDKRSARKSVRSTRKSVRSARDGTKPKRQTPRTAPV
jgi:hypothetical protein